MLMAADTESLQVVCVGPRVKVWEWCARGRWFETTKQGNVTFLSLVSSSSVFITHFLQSSVPLQSNPTHIFSSTYQFGSKSAYLSKPASSVRTTERRQVVALALYVGWFSLGDRDHERIFCDSLQICTDGGFLMQSNDQTVRLHGLGNRRENRLRGLASFSGCSCWGLLIYRTSCVVV